MAGQLKTRVAVFFVAGELESWKATIGFLLAWDEEWKAYVLVTASLGHCSSGS
ncbi:hypothetical protein RchiOBHm_Chr4g0405801 [Rosa chinensis]|uniref:Uncharacterized protein n=1 Tax=Rosa chinensis TaxID=74649 RepID=A0A2P6QU69_ROSCH|nr:hypothetical protein RchiOBHm_Chr4g0405801 [Rosa chinensis]